MLGTVPEFKNYNRVYSTREIKFIQFGAKVNKKAKMGPASELKLQFAVGLDLIRESS